ncbi:E3 ubiquitin-protein ligase ATL4-like [Phalaenopsis equestris]|uniref:E3 ubiquitin-protein ligase ATL4-like n=1 Tax=Phalaenopsis equestris TaxID=78828 RepID=UPI0009E3E502|nr:E3 ubiquitin-protein ligase ATL4-like [Phalaenopsis equestris]
MPRSVIIFLYLLDLIQYTIFFLLYRIGLNPSFETEPTPWDDEEFLFMSVGISMPTTTSTAQTLKNNLPVIDYKSFLERKRKSPMAEATPDCAICLQFIEPMDHVRELGNCCHEFHMDCMDRWLDLGRFNCPLCRSAVLPSEAIICKGPFSVLKVLLIGNDSVARGC